MKKNYIVIVLMLAYLLCPQGSHAQSFQMEISTYTLVPPQPTYTYASAITADVSGNLYTTDQGRNCIQKFDASGNFILKWGYYGTSTGELNHAIDLVVDNAGNYVYVLDEYNSRIQKFDANGNYVLQWAVTNPKAIGIDLSGNVILTDGNNSVGVYDPTGGLIFSWGGTGTGNGLFNVPSGIVVEPVYGNIFVVDKQNHYIQKFDPAGTFIAQFGYAGGGNGNGQFIFPTDITYDQGKLYIMDTGNNRVQVLDTTGVYITKWGNPAGGAGNGEFNYAQSITSYSGKIYVADFNNQRIQKFDNTGTYVAQWGYYGPSSGSFVNPSAVLADASGNIYIANKYNHMVQKYNSSGIFVTEWGGLGNGNSQFNQPSGLAFDMSGNIYVSDYGNHRVQKFDNTGVYVTQWGSNGSGNGQFVNPTDVEVDAAGHVFVVDAGNTRIQKFDPAGSYITQWGSYGSGNGQFNLPTGITIDGFGDVYVSDMNNSKIQKFNNNGVYITKWGGGGAAPGDLSYPTGLAVDSKGYIYEADRANNRIQIFDSQGNFMITWGMKGRGNSQFIDPINVAVDPSGKIYVVDMTNDRIQVFSAAGLPSQFTTWNGSSWDNGIPKNGVTAVINGNYKTSTNGNISCSNLIVNSLKSLDIDNNTIVNISGSAQNNGIINRGSCNSSFVYGTYSGSGSVFFNNPQIVTSSIPNPVVGQPYSVFLSALNSSNPIWDVSPMPPGMTINQVTGEFSGTPLSGGGYNLIISLQESPCTLATVKTIPVVITGGSAVSPNLSVEPNIIMTYSEHGNTKGPIYNTPSSGGINYSVYTPSPGAISYSVSPTLECVTIDTATGNIMISCAGPVSSYTLTVIQQASVNYSGDTTTAQLFLSKGVPQLSAQNVGILLSDPAPVLQYSTNSDALAVFQQIDGTTVASVDAGGAVTPLSEGTFKASITLPETDKFLSISKEVTVQVYTNPQPPVAVNDTIELLVGQELSFNILANDIGVTGVIVPAYTDIDLENEGVQSKFLDPASGTYVLDTSGLLLYKPFKGALGKVTLSYTVTDHNNNTSSPGFVIIRITQPGEQPQLKATELITPNDDGLNDAFVIGFVDKDKNNFLKVFDRNGAELFTVSNYQNDWQGTSSGGKALESGVYYYLFNENNGEKEIKGMLEIRR